MTDLSFQDVKVDTNGDGIVFTFMNLRNGGLFNVSYLHHRGVVRCTCGAYGELRPRCKHIDRLEDMLLQDDVEYIAHWLKINSGTIVPVAYVARLVDAVFGKILPEITKNISYEPNREIDLGTFAKEEMAPKTWSRGTSEPSFKKQRRDRGPVSVAPPPRLRYGARQAVLQDRRKGGQARWTRRFR